MAKKINLGTLKDKVGKKAMIFYSSPSPLPHQPFSLYVLYVLYVL